MLVSRNYKLDPKVLERVSALAPFGVKNSEIIRKLLVMYCNSSVLRAAVQQETGQTAEALKE